jgi:IS30 family transposase
VIRRVLGSAHNENSNGLLREYFSKKTDFFGYFHG